ncbi:SOS response-associated peptidase [candidate division WOR-3 bacterium]|nr:SOS response-associated peptidase [candidate division WOR-3 bacterium]
MCGRFAIKSTLEELKKDFKAKTSKDFNSNSVKIPSFNISPGNNIVILLEPSEIKVVKWGLVPYWSKEENSMYGMINARSESLSEKKSFSRPFREKRCAVLADGYFEWKNDGRTKTPYYFKLKTGETMAFAGIYDVWSKNPDFKLLSAAIITVEAQGDLRSIHERAPAIIRRENLDMWLDNCFFDIEKLQGLLKKAEFKDIEFYEVTKKVNWTKYDFPDCVEPL